MGQECQPRINVWDICNNRDIHLFCLYGSYITQYSTEPLNYLIISPMGGVVLLR